MRVVLLWTLFPTARTWGAPLPCTPSGDGCERVTTLSRSPGGCSGVDLGSRRCGLFFCGRCFRRRGRGALRSPAPPRVTGARGLRHSRALPEAVLAWIWVPDDAGCSFVDAVSDGAGVGRSAPLHPLGGRGARGLRPSRALPGLFWWEFWFPTMRATLMMALFPMVRAWGALLPYTPSGTGCERAATLSRSPGGCSSEGLVSDDAGYSFERFCFRRRGAWGAPLPYIPSGDGVREGSHPLALSRRVF